MLIFLFLNVKKNENKNISKITIILFDILYVKKSIGILIILNKNKIRPCKKEKVGKLNKIFQVKSSPKKTPNFPYSAKFNAGKT